MKYALWICFALVSLKGCSQEVWDGSLEKVVYTASSRGYFYQVIITREYISVNKDRNEENPNQMPIPDKEWRSIVDHVRTLDPRSLENMETENELSSTDRAAIAEVSILSDQEEYLSNPFDAGFPPKALEPLVNKMLVLAESVERQ